MQKYQKDQTSLWIWITSGYELLCARRSTKCVHTFLRACAHMRARTDMWRISNRTSHLPDKLLFSSWGWFFKLSGHQPQKCNFTAANLNEYGSNSHSRASRSLCEAVRVEIYCDRGTLWQAHPKCQGVVTISACFRNKTRPLLHGVVKISGPKHVSEEHNVWIWPAQCPTCHQ